MSDRAGQKFGNYRLLRKLGSGGFAEVYLGEHVLVKWQRAIKVLPMRLNAQEEIDDFIDEARTIAALKHDHIVVIHDVGIEESTPFLVMDYAAHGTLRQQISKGVKHSLDRFLPYIKQVAEALQYAHSNHIIHRDVKPENILLSEDYTIRLSDFGLAIVAQTTPNQRPQNQGPGTIAYTAPEQSENNAHYASDQYSLAIIVYELLCGTRPFNGNALEIMGHHKNDPPPPMHTYVPSLSPLVEAVVQKALSKDYKKRYPSVHDFAQALERAYLQVEQDQRTVMLASNLHHVSATTKEEYTISVVATPPQDSLITWNVPYRRNPFFTGNERVLTSIHEKFHSSKLNTSTHAINGLAGCGKTQLALEYAYRYHSDYDYILWLHGEEHATMLEDWNSMAIQLHRPTIEKEERVVPTIKSWLKASSRWLLVLDNFEDLEILNSLVPSNARGHILLTTRSQITGSIAQSTGLCHMERDEAILFLLRRTKKVPQDASLAEARPIERKSAENLTKLLGDHPLALDQAGAYIEETGCSLDDYICRFSTSHRQLLDRRGSLGINHNESVKATFVSLFEKVGASSSGGASALDLLRFCAFLDPSAIPEELLRNAAAVLGDALCFIENEPLALDIIIAFLRQFSLVHRISETKVLTIHPLIQIVLQDWMSETEHSEWVMRTVRAINQAFPDIEEVENWHVCQQAMPHVQVCLNLIKRYELCSTEAARLLYQAALYFHIQAQYEKANALFTDAIAMLQVLQESQEDTAMELRKVFWYYTANDAQGNIKDKLLQELAYLERKLAPTHSYVSTLRLKLGELCYKMGQYGEAEKLFRQSLTLSEQSAHLSHPCVACISNGLGLVNFALGKFDDAQTYFLCALDIWEKLPEVQHPYKGSTLGSLARLSFARGMYDKAETYFYQERVHLELTLQPFHPALAGCHIDWAVLCMAQGRYDQVVILLDAAQDIVEKTVGLKHAIAARVLFARAQFAMVRKKYLRAESLLQETLAIREQVFGLKHPDVASTIQMLANVYVAQHDNGLAKELYEQALNIRKSIFPDEHPSIAETLNGMGELALLQADYQAARYYFKRALAIREKAFGTEHPDVAQSLHNLAKLLSNRKEFSEAEPLYRRSLAIREKMLGTTHPDVGSTINSLAYVLICLGKRKEIPELNKRRKEIDEKYSYLDTMDV